MKKFHSLIAKLITEVEFHKYNSHLFARFCLHSQPPESVVIAISSLRLSMKDKI